MVQSLVVTHHGQTIYQELGREAGGCGDCMAEQRVGCIGCAHANADVLAQVRECGHGALARVCVTVPGFTHHGRDTKQAKESGNAEKDPATRSACECCVRVHATSHARPARTVDCVSAHHPNQHHPHQHRECSAKPIYRDAFSKPSSLSSKDTFVATFTNDTMIPTTTHTVMYPCLHARFAATNLLRPLSALTRPGLSLIAEMHRHET